MGPEIEGKRKRPKEKKEMSLGEVEEYKEKLTEMVEKAREIAKNEKGTNNLSKRGYWWDFVPNKEGLTEEEAKKLEELNIARSALSKEYLEEIKKERGNKE